MPYKPCHEVAEHEALMLKSYYIGEYDDGLLLSFEKVLNGRREWIDYYTYNERNSKLRSRRTVKSDGIVVEQLFDSEEDSRE